MLIDSNWQTEEFGLAASVDDLADVSSGEFSVFDFEFVGVYVVEPEFLAEVVSEVGESSG